MRKIIKEGKLQGIREAITFTCSCGEVWKTDTWSKDEEFINIIVSQCDNCGWIAEKDLSE